jgi:hypothetical protein
MKYLLPLLVFSAHAQPMQPERVADWPALDVRFYLVPAEQVQQVCPPFTRGCAIPLFKRRECIVVLAENDPVLRIHETYHCYGFDHIGESTMRDAWTRFKNRHHARNP